jgi:threonine aldolase
LGAPVGSVLVCKKELEPKARRMRKAFGGGMRQAGFLAAAASYALDNHITRLKEDHIRASELGKALSKINWVKSVMPVDTNIVIFSVADQIIPEKVLAKLADQQIKAIKFGAQEIRLVTHLDFDDTMLTKTIETIKKLSF